MKKNIYCAHMQKIIITIILLPLASLTTCGDANLSRPEGKKQIEKNSQINALVRNIPLQSNALQKGVGQDMWKVKRNPFTNMITEVILGDKPRQIIISVSPKQSLYLATEMDTFVLREPAAVRIEITGIADSPLGKKIKEVEFTWEYDNLPSLVKRFAVQGGTESALFRLFDDGWRLEAVKTITSDTPAKLSSQERDEELLDMKTAEERRAREIETMRVKKESAARRIKESQTPTKVIQTFTVVYRDLRGNQIQQKHILTDVDFEFIDSYGAKHKVWFGDFINLNPSGEYISIDFWSRVPLMPSERVMVSCGTQEEAIRIAGILRAAFDSWRSKFNDVARK